MFKLFAPLGAAILASLFTSAVFAREAGAECKGHWILSVSKDGAMVILIDQTVWQVAPPDRKEAMRWKRGSQVVVCPDRLISVDNSKTVSAQPMR